MAVAGVSYLIGTGSPSFSSAHEKPIASRHDSVTDLENLLRFSPEALEKTDIIEVNLTIAREIPECHDLDIAKYVGVVDTWADWIREETERNAHQFYKKPGDFNDSYAYYCAIMMCTVVGQDLKIGYDLDDFSFEQPSDLFVHGVIDQRKGSCVSLPVLYIALGKRLGYPIKAVAVPGHTFCRWEDGNTGERFNIEAANLGGLTDHPDEYYRHWPHELNPRWEEKFSVLKSLTMREHASVMVGALASYFEAHQKSVEMIRYDALSLWLDPKSRTSYISLRLGVDLLRNDYLDADEAAGRRAYWQLSDGHRK